MSFLLVRAQDLHLISSVEAILGTNVADKGDSQRRGALNVVNFVAGPNWPVLPVPVCPTVQSKQSFYPFKEPIWPLGKNALSCEILRWLSDCFLVNTVVFLPQALRLGTHTLFSYQGAVDPFRHSRGKVEMHLSARACAFPA